MMITNKLSARSLATIVSIALVALTTVLSANARSEDEGNKDSLYIGDNADNTVKRFDADTGMYQNVFVQSSSPKVCTPAIYQGRGVCSLCPEGISSSSTKIAIKIVQAMFYDTTAKRAPF